VGQAKYKRVLLKISGEALRGEQSFGICPEMLKYVADEVRAIYDMGVQLAIVVGGGNIFRGIAASSYGMDRTAADHMGMLATVINSLALMDALEKQGMPTRTQSAISMHEVAEPYILRRAIRHLERQRIVIFAAGTGNPYFTTDTAATLRATEIGAEMIIKATKVDGVYDKDPAKYDDAVLLRELTYDQALSDHIKVMDDTSIALAKDNKLPIVVCDMFQAGNILNIVNGDLSNCSIVK